MSICIKSTRPLHTLVIGKNLDSLIIINYYQHITVVDFNRMQQGYQIVKDVS